jgi:hypothetical protein
MTPRNFIQFFRSPTGALLVFILLLGIVLVVLIGFKPHKKSEPLLPVKTVNDAPQTVSTLESPIQKIQPPAPVVEVKQEVPVVQKETTPEKIAIPSISLFADQAKPKPVKPLTEHYAPFGRLLRCELIVTVDSSSINTPIIGLVTDDLWHNGEQIIAAGTEVHGTAQTDRTRERIASAGNWNLVWQDGKASPMAVRDCEASF